MEFIPEHVSALAGLLGQKPEVLQTFLTSAEAPEEVKPFAESLGKLKVLPVEDFNTRITNERKQASDQKLGETFEMVERRVKKETGIEQLSGESALDYQSRAYREKFSKTTDSEELQRLREEAQAAKDLLATKNTEFETYKTSIAKETAKQQVANAFTQAIGTVPLADPAQAGYVQFMFNEKFSSKLTESGIEYTDRTTGQVARNPNTAGLATASDLLQQFVPTIPGVSLKKPSASQPSGYQAGRNNANQGSAVDYQQFASRDDFNQWLRKQGIPAGSKEGGQHYTKFKEARQDLFT